MKKGTTKTKQEYLAYLSMELRSYYLDTIDGVEIPVQLPQEDIVKILFNVIDAMKQKNEDVTALI